MLSARHGSPGRLWSALTVVIVLAACGNAQASGSSSRLAATSPRPSSGVPALARSADQLVVPAPLVDPGLDLRAGPVDVPLELRIPRLRISAPVQGVGLTPKNVMDAPTGAPNDPVWEKAFWYRGSGIPGDATTAIIAGHVDDVLGRPALFASLKDLRPGDPIVVHDARGGVNVEFLVTETVVYTLAQTLDHTVLARIYGSGPADGQGPQPSPDGLAHLTLMTCTGHWVHGWGTFDQRLAVYAVSLPSPLTPAIASPHQRT